ncbi:hypothetical protein ACU5AY_13590 [Rhizobium sp. PAMB 3174]
MPDGDKVNNRRALWLTGLASAFLFAINGLWFPWRFGSELPHAVMPDKDIFATPESLLDLRERLVGDEAAASLLKTMHLTTDLVFPVIFAAFLFLLLRRLLPTARLRGAPLPGWLASALLALPLLYMASDYAENVTCLLFFPPAEPSASLASLLAFLLPWMIRLKLMFVTIIGVIVLRLTVLRPSSSTEG